MSGIATAVEDALDHIDDEPPATERRPAPYITALPAKRLFADSTYQRDLDELRVQRMVDDFDPTLLGVIEVSARTDGRFAILDGQHRWAAAKEAHPDVHVKSGVHLVCQVHRGLTVEEEARVFYEIDMRRKVLSGWDRWKARRGSGDPVVLAVEAIVHEHGLRIDPAPKDGVIAATKALEVVYDAGGEALLNNALFVLGRAYGQIRDAYDGTMIQGAALVLDAYDRDELDVDRLCAQLQKMPPRQVKARAQALKELHRAELPRLVAAVMVERYNTGGRKVEDLLTRAPSQGRALSKAGKRSRQLSAIRRWATREGLPVRTRQSGSVSGETIAAYTAAHPGFELAR